MDLFAYILILAICCKVPSVFGFQYGPEKLPKRTYKWTQKLMVYRLINMTAEILRDTTQKIKHATKIRDMHKNSITFELGTISAGIQERFQKMLKTYRQFATNNTFGSKKYSTEQYLQAYQTIQGEYNEIRLEKSLFLEIKKRHEGTTSTTVNYKKVQFNQPALMGGKKGGKNRRKWSRPLDDHFFNFNKE